MNTLGNRGEREKNAKPKFSTLDINNLYRTSRGEPTEPTAQKNAVPRKHGMQSLGKVPSARRPPANLPSLKAETSAPSNTSSSSNDQQQQQSQNQLNTSNSASWADSSATTQNSAGDKSLDKSQSSSGGGNTSWSSVANRKVVKEDAMLYQSPQFQNEFPSLDGSTTTSSTNVNASASATKHQQNPNSISQGGDSNEAHTHMKSTDSGGNWTQNPQHSNSGNARGGGAENGPSVYEAATANNNVPRTILALMPSFIKKNVQPADSGSPPPQQQQQSSNSSSMQREHHSHHRDQQHRDRDREQSYQREPRRGGNYGANYEYSNGPPRHQRQHQPPRLAGRSHNDDRSSSYEPEIIVQRPIIKDEELDRIDSLAKDDGGWSKHDEIDYNKKLQFSDDEIEDEKPKDSGSRHALRDNDRREMSKQNGPLGRSVDQQLIEKMNKRREEEERMERDRKLAAQKKLMELDSKNKDKDGGKLLENDDKSDDRKKEQRGSVDYGKKYDKYDSYDNYNRGGRESVRDSGAGANFGNKSSFQSNLPPRFQKQQLDHRQEKPGPPGFKPMMDNKNMTYSQTSSYEQRQWGYNKQQQQQPSSRRNMSSLSQSSSDDNNRRDNMKNYARRHLENEDDDFRKKSQAQTTRSMSESSDKLSDHNRSEKSTSREQLGTGMCWSESMENEKKSRRVSESSAMSDDQPRTILQRNKPLPEQLKEVKNEIKEEVKTEKSVLGETSAENDDNKKEDKIENKKNLESIPEKEQKDDKKDSGKALKELDDRHKKSSPRSNNYDSRYSRGGYSSYRGNERGIQERGGYSRRGNHRGGHFDYASDSDNSEEYDNNWKNKMGRKNMSYGQKEGFTPRGEPSRRGRGSSSATQPSNFRRSGSNGAIQPPAKNYGPPSSKSPFGSNDEKLEKSSKDKLSDDDRTKQKQKALSEGLMNKSQKESTNVATQKASSPAAKTDDSKQQHSTEQITNLSSNEKDKKLDDDLRNAMGQRSASSSSFNSNQGKKTNVQSTKTATTTTMIDTISLSSVKSTSKESQGNVKTSPSSQFSSSKPSSMPPNRNDRTDRNDTRNPNNSNSRMAPRFSKQTEGPRGSGNSSGNRLGTYWDKNTENEDKMSLNMLNNAPSSSISNNSSSNLLNSKTDMIKQSSQQQHQQSIQQQQQQQSQSMMDGPLKTTLIFENTNFKTAGPPGGISKRPIGQPQQKQENSINTINDMIDQQAKQDHQSLSSALQSLSFGQKPQSDMVNDMNFSYNFDSNIGLLSDDRSKSFGVVSSGSNSHPSQTVSKSSSLGLVGAKTGMQNSNILNTDALNMKVASCKKVWESDPSSIEHSGSGTTDDVMSNFVQQQQHLHQYGHHGGLLEHSLEHFNKSNDNDDGTSYPSPGQQQHMVHSQSQQAMKAAEAFATSKVKQNQQSMHQTGLSPPPQLQQSQLQQQQQQQQQQQTYYSTPSYSNMPTIPSPPAVYPQQAAAASGMYSHYMNDAARTQIYGYPTGNTNNSMSFNTFMQTPNLASVPTHDMYQNLSQYRTAVQPFNQTPQINNPNAAVLIQSATASANSMMSSKSSSQIGAIGSKSSQNAGPTAPTNQYAQQQYMNHLYHQQHNSYYTNSTAQQPNYYSGPTGTGAAATGNYGMFPSHGTNNGPPPQPQQMANFGSVGQFPIGISNNSSQMLNNLVINQQYRSGPVPGNNGNNTSGSNSNAPSGYMKQQHQSQLQDPWDSSSSNYSYQNRMYNNSQTPSTSIQSQSRWPTPIQRPNNNNYNNRGSPSPQYTNFQNYQSQNYQQRSARSNQNNSSMMSQGKSQNFSHSSKLKHEIAEKPKTHLTPVDDSKH